eukprot:2312928-Pyramimonas_sp.AAC.1
MSGMPLHAVQRRATTSAPRAVLQECPVLLRGELRGRELKTRDPRPQTLDWPTLPVTGERMRDGWMQVHSTRRVATQEQRTAIPFWSTRRVAAREREQT